MKPDRVSQPSFSYWLEYWGQYLDRTGFIWWWRPRTLPDTAPDRMCGVGKWSHLICCSSESKRSPHKHQPGGVTDGWGPLVCYHGRTQNSEFKKFSHQRLSCIHMTVWHRRKHLQPVGHMPHLLGYDWPCSLLIWLMEWLRFGASHCWKGDANL
jgi:hypothetical protein